MKGGGGGGGRAVGVRGREMARKPRPPPLAAARAELMRDAGGSRAAAALAAQHTGRRHSLGQARSHRRSEPAQGAEAGKGGGVYKRPYEESHGK